jgi:hypothetical protein
VPLPLQSHSRQTHVNKCLQHLYLMQNTCLQKLDLSRNTMVCNAIVKIASVFSLSLSQNSNKRLQVLGVELPDYMFFMTLRDLRFRSFSMKDVPPALWPHALATVRNYHSLILQLLQPISASLSLDENEKRKHEK